MSRHPVILGQSIVIERANINPVTDTRAGLLYKLEQLRQFRRDRISRGLEGTHEPR